jgi:hypothetical protein
MPDKPTENGRDGTGKFLVGHKGLSPGRPKVPEEHKGHGPAAWAALLATWTGVPPPDAPPGVVELAAHSPVEQRFKAVVEYLNRIYGRSPETLSIDTASPVLDLLVAMAKPVAPKE